MLWAEKPFANVIDRAAICKCIWEKNLFKCIWAEKPFPNLMGRKNLLQVYMGRKSCPLRIIVMTAKADEPQQVRLMEWTWH